MQPKQLNAICQDNYHLRDLHFPEFVDNSVGLIIGTNNVDLTASKAILESHKPNTPKGLYSKFGWSIAGPCQTPLKHEGASVYRVCVDDLNSSEDESLDKTVHEWWRVENYPIDGYKQLSKADQRALTILEQTTTHKNGRYEIGLLWKENVSMPNNFWLAKNQFISLKDRLEKEPAMHELFGQTVPKDLGRQFIEYSTDS